MALYIPSTTLLLLHGDGVNGSTTFTDSSGVNKAITAMGNAQISTAQSKWGGSSIYLDGASGTYLTSDTSFTLDSGDFTIETWVKLASIPTGATNAYIASRRVGVVGFYFPLNLTAATIQPFWNAWYSGSSWNPCFGPSIAASTEWLHFAVCKKMDSYTVFANGVPGVSTTQGNPGLTGTGLCIGKDQGAIGATYPIYIDDLRITKQALYTAAFTPPTAPLETDISIQIQIQAHDPGLHKLCKYDPSQPKPVIQEVTQDLQDRLPYGLWTIPAVVTPFEFKGRSQITGTTKETALPSNAPLSRLVRLHREPDGMFVKATWSDAAGNYTFNGLRPDCKYTITSYDYAGQYRAVIADNITPTPL